LFYIIFVYFYFISENRLKVFLDTLLELNEAGANFSDEELRDEVVTMMIGVSTTKKSKDCQQFLSNLKKINCREVKPVLSHFASAYYCWLSIRKFK